MRRDYTQLIKERFEHLQTEDHTNTQQKWDRAADTIVNTVD